jgi:isoleucyl-tRNA synthetase
MLPQPNAKYIDAEIVDAFEVLKTVVNSGRIIRDRVNKPQKYPLKELVIVTRDQRKLDDAKRLESYIMDELNIGTVTYSSDEAAYNIKMEATANSALLGRSSNFNHTHATVLLNVNPRFPLIFFACTTSLDVALL